MKISVILAHPDKTSFNAAIAKTCVRTLERNGHQVAFHDLYEEAFEPCMPAEEFACDTAVKELVASHCKELASTDGIIIVHPNWWGMPPAIMKGWIDRVFRPGIAYKFLEGDSGEGVPVGLLKARGAIVFNTSNTPHYREVEAFGDPLENLWKNCIFDLCGVHTFHRIMFGVVITSTLQQRQQWLKEADETVDTFFPCIA